MKFSIGIFFKLNSLPFGKPVYYLIGFKTPMLHKKSSSPLKVGFAADI
jgi:hypothetical protein